jgi:ABC-type Co2+ transport system, permease component
MHIPDGFIPLWQCAIYWIIALIALGYSLKWARENLDEKTYPLWPFWQQVSLQFKP